MKPNPAQTLSDRVKQWWNDHKKNDAAVIFFLLAVLLATIAYLIWGDDPWRRQLLPKFLAGEHLNSRDGIVLGLWGAAVINTVIATLLLLTSPWWPRATVSLPAKSPTPLPPSSLWSRRLFILGLTAALLTAAWIRAPRLDFGFWNDEEMAFRKFLWGENDVTDKDELDFKPVSWKRTFFYTANGNNHVTQTLASRISHEIWQRCFYREGDPPFNESVIRIPPFLSSIFGIAALALLLRTAGYPLAGVTAAWLLALNPWHLRYSVEARGYADLMLLIPLTFLCLLFALKSKKWHWWIAYGMLQSLYLLSFAGAVYLAVAQNLIVLALLLKQRKPDQIWRWGISTAIGAMLFLQIMIPMAIRAIDYAKTHSHVAAPITLDHLQDFWAHLIIGAPWKTMTDPALHNGISVQMYQADHPIILVVMAFIIPAILILGLISLLVKSCELRLFTASVLGAIILVGLHNSISETIFLIWYLIYTVLLFATALAFIPELIAGNARSLKPGKQKALRQQLSVLCAAVMIFAYGALTAPSLTRLRQFEREPMRAAVELVRGQAPALHVDNSKQLTCSIGSGAVQMRSYDPWVHPVKKQADFDKVLQDARNNGKSLSIYVCSPLRVQRDFPAAWKLLENEQIFEKTAYLKGLEEFWSFQIYQLKP